jgi:hypothetical protein
MEEVLHKNCIKCNIVKPLIEFVPRQDSKDGYRNICIICKQKLDAEYRQNNKEKISQKIKVWRDKNPEKCNTIYTKYRKTEKRKKIAREWNRDNRTKLANLWVEKYNTDQQFNLSIKIRRRIHSTLSQRRLAKTDTIMKLIGCTYNEFQAYIESKFTPEMTWDKVLSSEIHLDHITPVNNYDLSDPEQQKQCFHYTNLQPLWATTRVIDGVEYIGNLNKGARLI